MNGPDIGIGVEALGSNVRRAEVLRALEKKLLWLSSWMIHHANHIRPQPGRAESGRASGLLRVDRVRNGSFVF